MIRKLRNAELIKALDILPERERFIIQARFGVHDDITHTLEQVGAKLGLTRERVRQIEKSGLEVLRSFLADRKDMIG